MLSFPPGAVSTSSTGAATTPRTDTASRTQNSADAMWPTNNPVRASSRFARTSASIGTKACWNARWPGRSAFGFESIRVICAVGSIEGRPYRSHASNGAASAR